VLNGKGYINLSKMLVIFSLSLMVIIPQVMGAWSYSLRYQRPINGGYRLDIDKLYFRRNRFIHYGYCTIGYAALSPTGERGYVSAGHCVDGRINSRNWVWRLYQPSHVLRRSYYAGYPKYVYGDFSYIDTMFAKYSNVEARILTLNNIGYPIRAPITGYYNWREIHIKKVLLNLQVSKTGYSSGVTTGSYIRSYEIVTTSSGVTYKYLVLFTYYDDFGDSGGPVYTVTHKRIDGFWTAEIKLIGIHIGLFYLEGSGVVRGAISADGIYKEVGIRPMVM